MRWFGRSLLTRLAQYSLNVALRFWPAESRHWGEALAAELDSIPGPFEAVLWTFGGVLLFLRALGSRFLAWLRLPVGGRLSSMATGGDEPAFLPRRSRLVTALLLMGTAVLLLLPRSQEALSTVRASWRGFQESAGDLHMLDKLATRAEKEKDARTLAFVALSYSDPGRGMRYAERAVELDPALSWIYASEFYDPTRAGAGWIRRPRPVEWLKQLQVSDPENAFCYLLAAQDTVEPRLAALRKKGASSTQDATALKNDAEGLRLMGLAFHAPRYDSYSQQHWQLIHEVWNHESSLPFWVITHGLQSSRIPEMFQVDTFAKILIRRARDERAAGHPDQAAQILEDLSAFGSRMADAGNTDAERAVGLHVSRQALRELHTLYTTVGRKEQAQAAALQLQKTDLLRKDLSRSMPYLIPLQVGAFRWKATLVQFSVALMILCGLLTAIGLLSLELRAFLTRRGRTPLERLLCLTADYLPTMLLALSLMFLLSFRPFAQYLEQCREGHASVPFSHWSWSAQLLALAISAQGLSTFFSQGWVLAVVGLSLLALFIIARGLLRHRPAA